MTDEQPQKIEKITISKADEKWKVEVLHGPTFGVSGDVVHRHETLGDALDYIRANYSLG